MDWKRSFVRLQSWVFSVVVGLSCVILIAELYGITAMAALGPSASLPATTGFATALFTFLSVGPILSGSVRPIPSRSSRTPLTNNRSFLAVLCVLWLATAASTPSIMQTLAPNGCDALIGHARSVCGQLPFVGLYCYIISGALLVYTLTLSALTTKAIVDGHPDVWMASTWDLPYIKNRKADPSTDDLLYENA
ncbi:hypothetical protein EYR40_008270 [Pleurotus pulmonarius]|nr:hypothetical protein EYR36_009091 [Pleurotus pulmonarius]KAF4597803.1 hypothetical protein EYR40_008270 [Pleurotus pulmonarius]